MRRQPLPIRPIPRKTSTRLAVLDKGLVRFGIILSPQEVAEHELTIEKVLGDRDDESWATVAGSYLDCAFDWIFSIPITQYNPDTAIQRN